MLLDNNTNRNTKAILCVTELGTFEFPVIDSVSHHLVTLTDGEHEIHVGNSYTAYFAITTAATDGHRSGIYIKTPPAPQIHMLFSAAVSTAADYSILEAPTIAVNTGSHGAVLYNRKRNSSNISSVFDNATASAVNKFTTLSEAQIAGDGTWALGTVIRTEPLSIGSGPKPAGGTSREDAEYILNPDTAYVLLITNTTASANDHLVQIDFYEHVDM